MKNRWTVVITTADEPQRRTTFTARARAREYARWVRKHPGCYRNALTRDPVAASVRRSSRSEEEDMDRNRLSRQLKTLAIQAEAAWDRAVDGASEDLTAALARGEIPGVALEAATAAAMGEAMGAWEEAIAAAGRGDLRDAAYSLGIAAALGKEHGCDDPEQRALCLVREALGVDR